VNFVIIIKKKSNMEIFEILNDMFYRGYNYDEG